MLLQCDNKGCYKETEALLDKETDKVYCSDCGKEIQSNHMVRTTLKTLGQIKRDKKTNQAFSVVCQSCQENDVPVLKQEKLYCPKCNALHKLNPAFAQTTIAFLKTKK